MKTLPPDVQKSYKETFGGGIGYGYTIMGERLSEDMIVRFLATKLAEAKEGAYEEMRSAIEKWKEQGRYPQHIYAMDNFLSGASKFLKPTKE